MKYKWKKKYKNTIRNIILLDLSTKYLKNNSAYRLYHQSNPESSRSQSDHGHLI